MSEKPSTPEAGRRAWKEKGTLYYRAGREMPLAG
jgi:hypothetical protein